MANPGPSSSSGPNAISVDKTLSREAKLSMLTNAIEITATGKQVGTIDLVKVAFSAVGVVLKKIKDNVNLKDDFIDVGVYCAQICSAIERGTQGKSEGNLSPSFVETIKELIRTVNDIRATADENSSRTVLLRALFSDRDKEKIACWQQDLSRLLQIFSTELNVTMAMIVEEMHGKLDAVAEDVKDIEELRTDTGSKVSGERPPPPPLLFFGRDELVEAVLNHVQERKHVALIGAGGIGKTSIAKAVLNHSSAQKHFAGQFFLKCDNFVLSLDRFLGRVAEVVGATISQSAPLVSLCSFFMSRTHALLLVLDNAETILESPIKADVADAIDEISSCPMITLLITTRSSVLPNNTSWERTQVSPLDLHSSREAFFWVYKHEQLSSGIDPVLIEIDCHPLSINILASTAAQDSLSIDELKQRWDVERAQLLDPGPGSGKQQSLAASIQLSLNSPTMQSISEDALQVLQLISFLPQGVETTTLQQLVPTVRNASRIADTLGRLSLTSRQGKFITMLAPIRLYILDTRPPETALLAGITTFYCGKLDEYGFSEPGDEKFADGSWICSHDDNIERLIGIQLCTAPDESTVEACSIFLHCMYWHKPRKTTLGAVVEALHDNVSMYWKATSLQDIAHIAITTGNSGEAREFYNLARKAFLVGGYKRGATDCLIDLAKLSYNRQRYAEADRQCIQALAESQDLPGGLEKARCQELLGLIAVELGKHSEASEFLTKAMEAWERQNDMLPVGQIKVHLGRLEFQRENFQEARSHFDAATVIFSDFGDNYHIGLCSYEFGRQEIAARNFSKALDLLQKAEKSYLMANSTLEAASCVELIGRVNYYQKEYSAAKTLLTKAKEEFDTAGSIEDLIPNSYYLAWVKFREGNSQEAKQILKRAKQWFTEGNGYWQAMYARSLGEFAFHEDDYDGAAVLFAQAQGFEAVGFTSQNIDKEIPKEDLEGWRWFHGADWH